MDQAETAAASGAPSGAPLLEAVDARISIDDVVAIDRLSLATRGDRVFLAGDVEALFAALTGVSRAARSRDAAIDDMPGEARVTAGSLRIAGSDVAKGAHFRVMGAAPLDPPLPPAWTAEDYVAASARLAGASPRAARDLASASLAKVGLVRARARALRTLSLPERRAVVLAHAAVMSPPVLVVEAPLSGLEGPAASFVLTALAGVTSGRGAIVSGAHADPRSPEGSLSRSATYVAVLVGGKVALEGPPGELFSGAMIYGLTVRSNEGALREELAARGIELRGGPLRFSVSLPEGATTREILAAARASKAALTELVPLV